MSILGRFKLLYTAEQFMLRTMQRAGTACAIVLGDDGYIWVMPLQDALRAADGGYTLV